MQPKILVGYGPCRKFRSGHWHRHSEIIQWLSLRSKFAGHLALSVLPESIEPIGRKLGVEDGVLDIPVAQIKLDRSGVLAVVGQLVSGRVPKHVRVDRHAQLGSFPGPCDELSEGGLCHGGAALGDEDGVRVASEQKT